MQMHNVNMPLYDLDAVALCKLAEHYEAQAEAFKARAALLQNRQSMSDRNMKELMFYKRLPDTVMRFLRQGHPINIALEMTSGKSGVKLKTVQVHWHKFLHNKRPVDLGKRNQLIVDLGAMNVTNEQIGNALGLHPNSVSRIRGQMIRMSFALKK